MISPDGIKYEPLEYEFELPEDMEKLVPDKTPDPSLALWEPVQK